MVVFSIASAVIDSSVWAIIINVLAIVCGVVCIIEMIAMGKENEVWRDCLSETILKKKPDLEYCCSLFCMQ